MKYVLHLDKASLEYPCSGGLERELGVSLFEQQELQESSTDYRAVRVLLNRIREGNAEGLEAAFRQTRRFTVGAMSESLLRQAQYTLVATIAQVTFASIEGGMLEAEAYALSDAYIRKGDVAKTPKAVYALLLQALRDFVRRVKSANSRICSEPVRRCCDYISSHLHDRIRLRELAAEAALSPQYLSCLFKREMGEAVSEYILERKLEEAKVLLEGSEFSVQGIASVLAFSTHSHFSAAFRKAYGVTPRSYRLAATGFRLPNTPRRSP